MLPFGLILWSHFLVQTLCIEGDFNMIEALEDQCGGSQTMTHGVELAAWEWLCMSLGVEDVWHH